MVSTGVLVARLTASGLNWLIKLAKDNPNPHHPLPQPPMWDAEEKLPEDVEELEQPCTLELSAP